MSKSGVKRRCTVVSTEDATKVKVHYAGFKERYDEWIETASPRVVGRAE